MCLTDQQECVCQIRHQTKPLRSLSPPDQRSSWEDEWNHPKVRKAQHDYAEIVIDKLHCFNVAKKPHINLKCIPFLRALCKLVGTKPQTWDEYLDAVMFGLRTKKQMTTTFSPYFLMFGREARYPAEIPEDYQVCENAKFKLNEVWGCNVS